MMLKQKYVTCNSVTHATAHLIHSSRFDCCVETKHNRNSSSSNAKVVLSSRVSQFAFGWFMSRTVTNINSDIGQINRTTYSVSVHVTLDGLDC
jgi:hypothetical protein